MVDITSEHGYIGPFWWVNSQPSERQWLANRYWRLWGTFGIGRKTFHVELDACND